MDLLNMAETVLSNLSEIESQEYIASCTQLSRDSSILHLEPVFADELRYREEHGEDPDPEFLLLKHPQLFCKSGNEFSKSIAMQFLSSLKKESQTLKAQEALADGDVSKAREILSEGQVPEEEEEFDLDDVMPAYEEMLTRPAGILVGAPEIDELIRGLTYGTVTTIAAPPGSFKTTTAVSVIYDACVKKAFNFIFITLEIMKKDWWFSLVARHSAEMGCPISAEEMKKGLLSDEDKEIMARVVKDLKESMNWKIKVLSSADMGDFNNEGFKAKVKRLDQEYFEDKLDGIILDYVQLMKFWANSRDEQAYVNNKIRFFHTLATDYEEKRGLIVILLSQVNRDGIKYLAKKRKGSLTLLAEFNELERSSHNVIILYAREEDKLANQVGTSVPKNRTGATSEDFKMAFVDPGHFVFGAQGFQNLFTEESLNLLDEDAGDFDGADLFG